MRNIRIILFVGKQRIYDGAVLLHFNFVDAEELSMSRFLVFLGGRMGGDAGTTLGGEAVDGVGPISSFQNVDVGVWIGRGLGTDVWGIVVGLWFLFRDF